MCWKPRYGRPWTVRVLGGILAVVCGLAAAEETPGRAPQKAPETPPGQAVMTLTGMGTGPFEVTDHRGRVNRVNPEELALDNRLSGDAAAREQDYRRALLEQARLRRLAFEREQAERERAAAETAAEKAEEKAKAAEDAATRAEEAAAKATRNVADISITTPTYSRHYPHWRYPVGPDGRIQGLGNTLDTGVTLSGGTSTGVEMRAEVSSEGSGEQAEETP